MKRVLALLLILTCMLFAIGCEEPQENEPSHVYFIGTVESVSEASIMVEVTDAGDCGLTVGTPASVSLYALGENKPTLAVGDSVRVEFDGVVQESYPVGIPTVFSVVKV